MVWLAGLVDCGLLPNTCCMWKVQSCVLNKASNGLGVSTPCTFHVLCKAMAGTLALAEGATEALPLARVPRPWAEVSSTVDDQLKVLCLPQSTLVARAAHALSKQG